MIEIKILGTGCPKCSRLEQLSREAIAETGLEATVTHVTEVDKIFEYPITVTPALVINEEVKSSGNLPRKPQIIAWFQATS